MGSCALLIHQLIYHIALSNISRGIINFDFLVKEALANVCDNRDFSVVPEFFQ